MRMLRQRPTYGANDVAADDSGCQDEDKLGALQVHDIREDA